MFCVLQVGLLGADGITQELQESSPRRKVSDLDPRGINCSSAKAGGSGLSSGTAECDSCSGCPAQGDYTEFSILPKLGNASG